jgi:hypothetical protein
MDNYMDKIINKLIHNLLQNKYKSVQQAAYIELKQIIINNEQLINVKLPLDIIKKIVYNYEDILRYTNDNIIKKKLIILKFDYYNIIELRRKQRIKQKKYMFGFILLCGCSIIYYLF